MYNAIIRWSKKYNAINVSNDILYLFFCWFLFQKKVTWMTILSDLLSFCFEQEFNLYHVYSFEINIICNIVSINYPLNPTFYRFGGG